MDHMESAAAVQARRARDIIRIDLSVLRGEVKSLYLYARAHGTQHDVQVTKRALQHLDAMLRELDDPALLHPTLF